MIKTSFWIYVSLAVVLAKVIPVELPEKVQKELSEKWKKCCMTNKCINNSCYIVEWSSSNWATVRQRCQNQYPDWPYAADIFRVQNEKDVLAFWKMLQKPAVPMEENPKSVWTGGMKCPKTNENGTTLVTRWVSSNQQFPVWLDAKLRYQLQNTRHKMKGCEFLVISPMPNETDVKYGFQDQNAHHPAICELIFPSKDITTESENSREETTQFSSLSTEKKETTPTIQPSTKITSTHVISSSERPKITAPKTTKSSSVPSRLPSSTTSSPKYCEGLNASGISWRKTKAGDTARQKCAEQMIGFAEWKCDEVTLTFQPEKPNTENCKQKWVYNLEERIQHKHDAVEISSELAKDTNQNMTHGDIIALVNLTSSLVALYAEQKGEEEFEDYQNEEVPIYYNFTKDIITSISNILRTEIKEAWEGLNETRQTREASTILKLVTTIGSRLSCIKTTDGKLQFTVSADNIDLQTFIVNETSENDVIVFPQQTDRNRRANSSIVLPTVWAKKFTSCKSYSSAVGVIYKHVGDLLKTEKMTSSTTRVATKVLSFSLSNATQSIPLNGGKVNITLQHLLQEDVQYQVVRNPRCVFWNFSKSEFGAWDTSGCDRISFNETHTLCQCDHLTNFAVLMDINHNIQDDDVLTLMTYVCCGFSSFALFLTLICFLLIRSLHGRRSIITGNLCLSLLITNVLIIFGLDKTQNKVVCAIVAGVLHYWILSAFCWMLVEGYHLYRMVILVFQRGSNLPVKFYYIFAYGTPLIVVGISAGIRHEEYGGDQYCWLSGNDGLMWSFVGPACAIILVNIVIFVLTLRSASSVKIKREQSTIKKIKSWIRGSISVMCLLGLTWCIGLFYIDRKLHFFSYVFTILNGLQGAFIFMFHILLNDKVSNYCSCSSQDNRKHGRKKFLNQTSSNPSNSKTSTRTSMNSFGCTSSTKLTDTRKKSVSSPPLRNGDLPNGNIAVVNTVNPNCTMYRNNNVTRSVSGKIVRHQASHF